MTELKIGDIVDIFWMSDDGKRVNLPQGIITKFGNAETGEDLVFVMRPDGSIQEYSRNITTIKFEVKSCL